MENIKDNTLYIVATPIGNLSEISLRAKYILENVDFIYCEDTRVTIKILNYLNIKKPLIKISRDYEIETFKKIQINFIDKKKVALVSDAGMPLVSDPGKIIVENLIENNYNIVPISGPSAVINSLVASGLSEKQFFFYGFLERKEAEIKKKLLELENLKCPIIIYESPKRIIKSLKILKNLYPAAKIFVCRELTKKHETFYYGDFSNIIKDVTKNNLGEYVIVIKLPIHQTKAINFSCYYSEIKKLNQEGLSVKSAIAIIANKEGLSKNSLYKNYHMKQKEEK